MGNSAQIRGGYGVVVEYPTEDLYEEFDEYIVGIHYYDESDEAFLTLKAVYVDWGDKLDVGLTFRRESGRTQIEGFAMEHTDSKEFQDLLTRFKAAGGEVLSEPGCYLFAYYG